MAYKFDEDGLKVDQPCKDPSQRGWADWLDSLAQDVRDGKVSIKFLRHHIGNGSIEITYEGMTTK